MLKQLQPYWWKQGTLQKGEASMILEVDVALH